MKIILTILTFLSLHAHAQTKVEAENYSKGNNVEEIPADLSIKTIDKSYADYPIKVSKSTYYIFKMTVRNGTEGAYINIKTPTGRTVLASVLVPVGDWQEVTAKVKLSKTTKKIRFVFGGSCEMNYFTYTPLLDTAKPPSAGVSQADFNALKAKVDALAPKIDVLSSTVQSLRAELDKRVLKFNPKKFAYMADSTITTLP